MPETPHDVQQGDSPRKESERPKSERQESARPKSGSSRRSFLAGLATTGAIAAFSKRTAALQNGSAASRKPARVHTHHHFTTPNLFQRSTAKAVNQPPPQRWPPATSTQEIN